MSTNSGAVVRSSSRRKLFAPTPIATASSGDDTNRSNGSTSRITSRKDEETDAALAAALSASEARTSYSLRRRTPIASTSAKPNGTQKRANRTSAKRARAATPSSAEEDETDSAAGSEFSHHQDGSSSDHDSDVFSETEVPTKRKSRFSKTSTPRKSTSSSFKADKTNDDIDTKSTPKRRAKSASSSPKKPAASPFDVSPRKPTKKPLKVNLLPHEAHPAPPHWETVYALLAKQRAKIIAPVDTMGCEENGRQDRRADSHRPPESPEESAKRERVATLVSLMLSSQTKDPVTAEAVYNLQRTLPNGLCLQSLLEAEDSVISSCIAKVGFWRRKTGYLKSAARILAADFAGDVPRTVDELVSLPGVGPKMAFLALSSMGIQVGIGVDTHVHRLTNRLGWHTTKTPEETRLNLQSWLPEPLHGKINRLLVGFGQVICVPVGPRCDLCDVAKSGLCPSRRDVDEKSIEKRVKVDLLDSDDDGGVVVEDNWVKSKRHVKSEPGAGNTARVKVEVELDGPDGPGSMEVADLLKPPEDIDDKAAVLTRIKQEDDTEDAGLVEKALDW